MKRIAARIITKERDEIIESMVFPFVYTFKGRSIDVLHDAAYSSFRR